MPSLSVTPLARGDIKDIGRYTQTTWGMAQGSVANFPSV